ncbi:MAG: S8 family peptidase [Candidatus Pristimantibacillus sp.]
MAKLGKLITLHSRPTSSQHTIRKLITFRTTASYKQCLSYMHANGIQPFRQLPRSRMIGCHFIKHSSWKAISRHPDIRLIEKDARIKVHAAYPVKRTSKSSKTNGSSMLSMVACPVNVTWNVCNVRAHEVWRKTLGSPIKVAVIDTGIAKHPDLQIAGGVNLVDGGSYVDDNGHGTHVAGIAAANGMNGIKGVAPDIKLYAVKALDHEGSGYVSDIVAAIDWCIRNGMNIINMSFGITGGESSGALHNIIKRATNKGIIVVASAGNDGPSNKQIEQPASYSETISVAASTRNNRIADTSSRGEGITLCAPGENIRSTWLNGKYFTLTGTSMASPHVTGGIALLLSLQPDLRPSEVKAKLQQWAMRLNDYPTTAQGSGLLQLNRI